MTNTKTIEARFTHIATLSEEVRPLILTVRGSNKLRMAIIIKAAVVQPKYPFLIFQSPLLSDLNSNTG